MTLACAFRPTGGIARTLLRLVLLATATSTTSAQVPLEEPTSRGGIGAMRTVQIMDESGFDKAIPAATMLVPEGWRTSGGVRWQPQTACRADGTQFAFTALDPRGQSAIELIPGTGWSLPSQGYGCPPYQIRSARQYLEALARQIRPQPVIEAYRDRPDLLTGATRSVQNQSGFQIEQRASAGQVLIAYTQGGIRMQEIIMATVNLQFVRTEGIQGIIENMDGEAGPALAMRAPYGRLDLPIAERVRRSFAFAPEWRQRMAQHTRVLDADTAETVRARSRITSETAEAVDRINREAYERRQKDIDRGHRRSIDGIWEVERRKKKDEDDD